MSPKLARHQRLKKEIRLLDLYAISTGATLSAGFFLLPGIAATEAGPALVLAYLLAAVPMVPAMFSVVELATAMPRAGGVYYFLDRSLGPLAGTVGGFGTWCALVLKVAFALIGMGAYIHLFVDGLPLREVAIGLAIGLGILNSLGARKTGGFQIFLVSGLLLVLALFIGGGLPRMEAVHFEGFLDAGTSSILSTVGLVYISYVGVTKVASLSEEVEDPERNLPRAVFLSLGTATIIYGLGTAVMVGVLPQSELAGDLTPVASAADAIFGKWGKVAVTVAALLAFVSVANAGTLSASRYPLAMSRDHMLPRFFSKLGKSGTPIYGILSTVVVIVLILAFLDATKIAKLASAFQLLMFAFVCLAVIVMRESQIDSYDPGYPSPFYPWMQILGIVAPLVLIREMGVWAVAFSAGLVLVGVAWYFVYADERVVREGAIYHLFERLGQRRYEGLDWELRGILKEKGLRSEDPFDEVVGRSAVVDVEESIDFEELLDQVVPLLAERVPATAEELRQGFLEGTRVGATPVTHGVALPHVRLGDLEHPEMVIVRCRPGIDIPLDDELIPGHRLHPHHDDNHTAFAAFFLASPDADPAQHLRILAQLAERVDEHSFRDEWIDARDEQRLKEVLLRDECFLSLRIHKKTATASLLGRTLRDIHLPEGALITAIRRGSGRILVPSGSTELRENDRVTIIGTPERIRELEKLYRPHI